MNDGIGNWGDTLMVSTNNALLVFTATLPKILAFVLILLIGWFVASLLAKGVALVLRNIKFNELAERAGLAGFIRKMDMNTDAAGFFAGVVKWFIRLIALVVAFDALGLPAVSDFLRQVLLWLPNLIVALVVLVIGGLAAKALAGVVRAATAQADLGKPETLAKIASFAVWTFAVIVAVNQLGIAVTLVNTLFMAAVGALALALGLAFGLGARETAGKIVADWYEKGRTATPKLRQAVEAAGTEARGITDNAGDGTRRIDPAS
jgi:small-conductance mechanosensitive channel